MRNLIVFFKKLQAVTGTKMYLNIFLSILISALEGISIYLLIPMLAVIGLLNMQINDLFPITLIVATMEKLPFQLNLTSVLLIYLLLIGGQALLQRSQTILNTDIQQNFIKQLRLETYESLIKVKWEYMLRKRKSDFNYILTTEISRVGVGTHSIIQLISIVFFTIVQIMLAFLLSPSLTSIVLIIGGLLSIFMRKFVRNSKTIGKETTELMNDYFGGITEQFSGMKDMKSNMLEPSFFDWFQSKSHLIHYNVMNLVRLNAKSVFIYRLMAGILIVLFVSISFSFLKLPPEKLMIIILIFSRLWPRFSSLQSNVEQIVSMFPALDHVLRVQAESNKSQEWSTFRTREWEPFTLEQAIECDHVYFRYQPSQEDWTLTNVNIHFPLKKTTAIVGPSGAGKTTLVDLVMGLLQPEKGRLLVNGKSLTEEELLLYRNSISYVAQEPFLFHSSIRENLLMVAPKATELELWQALSFAAAENFVKQMPEGLDTVIGDRGIRLSGGERQRLVLARAILRKPAILILDEATSALDSENEQKIQQAIDQLKGRMTIIVIAHRLSTIRNADKVMVLESGKVIQEGEYKQLAQTKGALRKMLVSQELAGNQTLA
ncbi:ABC transporter [Niallia circulans]|uniref:ABC transporter ATP-binding protein n=1 Tax=Niallia circulans TaxID=1397 RepID=UPI00077C7C08|nr:ABC transporter ATP-binding protein [Niallia circulans]MDR4317693.1 ABC transporter ATP-binding protein [Niallia circulans]MED3841173.1 ABC transporter ATP-binding protein [Niallia circulans]MED4245750.1 ABC transporter ATP-binding protein [Niallia circulans]MED4247668.1 ABC transporter ATP-binding protein [Niallia circulans]QKH63361.1 ABC transporter ATP-binding protein [Niallia circulans]